MRHKAAADPPHHHPRQQELAAPLNWRRVQNPRDREVPQHIPTPQPRDTKTAVGAQDGHQHHTVGQLGRKFVGTVARLPGSRRTRADKRRG